MQSPQAMQRRDALLQKTRPFQAVCWLSVYTVLSHNEPHQPPYSTMWTRGSHAHISHVSLPLLQLHSPLLLS